MQVDQKQLHNLIPTESLEASSTFGIKKKLKVPFFKKKEEMVPTIDENYIFDEETTMSILVGFKHNKKVFCRRARGAWSVFDFVASKETTTTTPLK